MNKEKNDLEEMKARLRGYEMEREAVFLANEEKKPRLDIVLKTFSLAVVVTGVAFGMMALVFCLLFPWLALVEIFKSIMGFFK